MTSFRWLQSDDFIQMKSLRWSHSDEVIRLTNDVTWMTSSEWPHLDEAIWMKSSEWIYELASRMTSSEWVHLSDFIWMKSSTRQPDVTSMPPFWPTGNQISHEIRRKSPFWKYITRCARTFWKVPKKCVVKFGFCNFCFEICKNRPSLLRDFSNKYGHICHFWYFLQKSPVLKVVFDERLPHFVQKRRNRRFPVCSQKCEHLLMAIHQKSCRNLSKWDKINGLFWTKNKLFFLVKSTWFFRILAEILLNLQLKKNSEHQSLPRIDKSLLVPIID